VNSTYDNHSRFATKNSKFSVCSRVPLQTFNMPQKNKWARQAQAQRIPDSRFFSSGFIDSIDDDEIISDPDYIDNSDEESDDTGLAQAREVG
jgi:hypothetical protein